MLRLFAASLALVLGASIPVQPVAAAFGHAAAAGSPTPRVVAASPVSAALSAGVANASKIGVTTYAMVMERGSGKVVAKTANANTQVASESIMKMFIAASVLLGSGGVGSDSLRKMITHSDDPAASAHFTRDQIPQIAARYGMTNTANPPGSRWGASRITAADIATFLHRADRDPAVGPWLFSAMADTTDVGSDGFNQNFGLNPLGAGTGSKQGWGADSWVPGEQYAIHSVGFTARHYIVVLQTGGYGTYLKMRDTATFTVARIVKSLAPKPNSPIGRLDGAAVTGNKVKVAGWAFDKDSPSASVRVHIFVTVAGKRVGYSRPTDVRRVDVNRAYGIPGNHGFSTILTLKKPGVHTICATAINIGTSGGNTSLGCRSVRPAPPIGSVDRAVIDGKALVVSGWTADPAGAGVDNRVHIYVRSRTTSVGYATAERRLSRPDVAAAMPWAGPNTGFRLRVPVPRTPGSYDVCAYAISSVVPGLSPKLGCRTVTVPAE